MRTHKDLVVWQKSMDLAKEVYHITAQLPKAEVYGISSQMQRAAVGIPSNIAEGAKRNHITEYTQFLSISMGSAAELETQLLLSKDLFKDQEIDFGKALDLSEEVLKMLNVLIASLKKLPPRA